jgi:hypothetical protein
VSVLANVERNQKSFFITLQLLRISRPQTLLHIDNISMQAMQYYEKRATAAKLDTADISKFLKVFYIQ